MRDILTLPSNLDPKNLAFEWNRLKFDLKTFLREVGREGVEIALKELGWLDTAN